MSHLGLKCPNPTWRNHHFYFQTWLGIRLPQMWQENAQKMDKDGRKCEASSASFDLLQGAFKGYAHKKNHEQLQGLEQGDVSQVQDAMIAMRFPSQ